MVFKIIQTKPQLYTYSRILPKSFGCTQIPTLNPDVLTKPWQSWSQADTCSVQRVRELLKQERGSRQTRPQGRGWQQQCHLLTWQSASCGSTICCLWGVWGCDLRDILVLSSHCSSSATWAWHTRRMDSGSGLPPSSAALGTGGGRWLWSKAHQSTAWWVTWFCNFPPLPLPVRDD